MRNNTPKVYKKVEKLKTASHEDEKQERQNYKNYVTINFTNSNNIMRRKCFTIFLDTAVNKTYKGLTIKIQA